MPPHQPYQPSPQQPQRSFTPHAPHVGYGQSLQHPLQQHPDGHYEVVPPPQPVQNNPASGHNPYEFIMNPNTQPKPGFSLTGGNFFKQIAFLAGGVVVLLIVAALIISHFTPKGPTAGLISISQRQQEIIRVATDATTQTTGQDTTNFVSNVMASITSDQQQTLSYLATHGTKLKGRILNLDKSATTDTTLANALTANNYDNAVTENLSDQLQAYESLLQSTYKTATGPVSKKLLQTNFNNAVLLAEQAKTLQHD